MGTKVHHRVVDMRDVVATMSLNLASFNAWKHQYHITELTGRHA